MAISADFTINGVANPARHETTYGATVNLAVVNTAGIDSFEWVIESSSESGDTLPTITAGGAPSGATASFTMVADPADGRGRTMMVKLTVRTAYETAISRGVVGVLNSAGSLPICANEGRVRDATGGWLYELNTTLNATGTLASAADQTLLGNQTGGSAVPAPIDTALVAGRRDAVSSYIAPFETAATLRAFITANGTVAGRVYRTTGAITVGDDWGGDWVTLADAAPGTYTDNTGTILTNADGSKAVKRLYDDIVQCGWFGAVADSNGTTGNGTDNTADLQAAFDAAQVDGQCVEVPALASGVFRAATTLSITASMRLAGQGTIFHDGSGTDCIFASGASGLKFSDITIKGNNTGTGGGGTTGADGNGITLHECDDVDIGGVTFSGIGIDPLDGSASPIAGKASSNIRIHDCYFDDTCHNETGADIVMSRGCNKVTITGCVSLSECDQFAVLGSDQTDPDHEAYIAVTGNVAIRPAGTLSRHGILVAYGGTPARVTISGNIFEGFRWNGVYSPGEMDDTADPPGEVTVTGNIFRYCGGESDISAGVLAAGQGWQITGNYFYRVGYDPADTVRTYARPAILIRGNSRDCTITGNTIFESHGYGAFITSSQDVPTSNIIFSNNVITDCDAGGVVVEAVSNTLSNVTVSNNMITLNADFDGIRVEKNLGTCDHIFIHDNKIRCTVGDALAGTQTNRGIYFENPFVNCSVIGNRIEGFDFGFRLNQADANRDIPDVLMVKGNSFTDCDDAMFAGSGDQGIFLDCEFNNCNVTTNANVHDGRMLGYNAAGLMTVEVARASAPSSGTWRAGDRTWDPDSGSMWLHNGTTWQVMPIFQGFATGSRPASPDAGVTILDTTLGHAVTYNGTNWVDGSGNVV